METPKPKQSRNYGEAECAVCGKIFSKRAYNSTHCEDCCDVAKEKVRRCDFQRARGMKLQDGSLPNGLPPSRTCHDCGAPTNNYRCAECWMKIQHGLNSDIAAEEYSVSYSNHSRS